MSSETNNREPWSPCPAGALQSYANQSRTRRWWITVLWTSSVTTLLLCVAGLTIWSVNQRVGSEYRFGGIACPQVRENFIAYQAGTLSDDLSRRIRIHLQKCPECHEFMQNNGGGGKVSAMFTPPDADGCPHCRNWVTAPAVPGTVVIVSSR